MHYPFTPVTQSWPAHLLEFSLKEEMLYQLSLATPTIPPNQKVPSARPAEHRVGPCTRSQKYFHDLPRHEGTDQQDVPLDRFSRAVLSTLKPIEPFKYKLKTWTNNAPSTTEKIQRKEASRKIFDAFLKDGTRLSLEGMQLTSLPDCLSDMTSLRQLQIDNNKLRELPELPENLLALLAKNNNLTFPAAVDPDEVTLLYKTKSIGFIFPLDTLPVLR